jgi:hypothetical protein
MIAAPYPLYVRRHEDRDVAWLLTQDVPATAPATGTVEEPLDLTGYTARMSVREQRDDTSRLLAEFDTVDGTIVITGATGRVDIPIPAAVSGAVDAGRWSYDLRLEEPGGDGSYLLYGPYISEPSVTRP